MFIRRLLLGYHFSKTCVIINYVNILSSLSYRITKNDCYTHSLDRCMHIHLNKNKKEEKETKNVICDTV